MQWLLNILIRLTRKPNESTADEIRRLLGLEVFKVQLPIATNDPDAPALCYTEGRKNEIFIPIDKKLKKLFKDLYADGITTSDKKAYIPGRVIRDKLDLFPDYITKEDQEQDW